MIVLIRLHVKEERTRSFLLFFGIMPMPFESGENQERLWLTYHTAEHCPARQEWREAGREIMARLLVVGPVGDMQAGGTEGTITCIPAFFSSSFLDKAFYLHPFTILIYHQHQLFTGAWSSTFLIYELTP